MNVRYRAILGAVVATLGLPRLASAATSAIWRRANNNPVGGTLFSPVLGSVGRSGPTANPTLYIWIGGTVNPALTAKPGIYQGTIILSLTYL